MAQAAYIHHLEERIRQGQQQQMKIVNYGWSCAVFILERMAVIEARARNTHIDLMDDLAEEEELEAVRKAYSHTQARIVSLEAALSKSASQHKAQVHALAMSNLAVLKINRAQGEELKNLKHAIIARQEEQEAEVHRSLDMIKLKTAKIEAMTKQRKMTRRVQNARQHAHRQIITAHVDKIADLDKMITDKDKNVKRLQHKVASLDRMVMGAIAQRKEREDKVISLRAEIETTKDRAAEGAVTTVIRQLATTEQLGAMEQRAKEAEERVMILERERAENDVKIHHTICRLASVHAKQLADLEARKMNVDAPAPATVIGKRTSEWLDFSARHVGRQRRDGGRGRLQDDGRPSKRPCW